MSNFRVSLKELQAEVVALQTDFSEAAFGAKIQTVLDAKKAEVTREIDSMVEVYSKANCERRKGTETKSLSRI